VNGILYLVPVPIADGDPKRELSPRLLEILGATSEFIVENQRTAKRFLAAALGQEAADRARFGILDKRSAPGELAALLEPLELGRDAAIMSEAGSPCVADPGAALVELAHRKGLRVVALPGPSAILMALMASGLGGQRFAFNGYLPPDEAGRISALRELERQSAASGATQLFIETPYRNDAMFKSALKALQPATLLCVAYALSSPFESVDTRSVEEWRRRPSLYGTEPAVFLLAAPAAIKPAASRPVAAGGAPGGPARQGRPRGT
jgi:16S rRNA (cytidine1402-2'-O)-methyltransferase